MSDGVENSGGENEEIRLQRASPDDYGRALAKVAVTQISERLGFDAIKQSALEALSDITVRYICDLGRSASLYASLAGRSEVNLFDIVKGLEELSSNRSSSSELDHCVMESRVLKELSEFICTLDETPFAIPIAPFPVVKCQRGIPSFSQMGEVPSGKHIPTWLPAFPDPHTYIYTPMWNERKMDPRTDKVEQVRQRRKAERSLLSLQQRLLSNSLAGPSGSGDYHHVINGGDNLGAKVENGPFLAQSLPIGGTDISVSEIFSPAIDAMKSGDSDSMELDQRMVSERRPVVHFRLKVGKKMLVEDLDVNLRSLANGRKSSMFSRDDEKDDKKRRAELILRQSMENFQDLSQM